MSVSRGDVAEHADRFLQRYADAVVVAANESNLMYGVHITWPASSSAALTTVSSTQNQSGSLSPSTVTGDLLFSSTEIL